MIRSWIGIVCVLVFVTTCVQTTAAQAHGNFPTTQMRNRVLPTQIRNWIELADQGVSDRILSSDGYHNDFRFRAAPVKQSPNWQMPIVDVRSARDLSITLDAENGSAAPKAQRSSESNIAPVVDWVWESSSDLAVRYSELSSAFDQAAMAVIPRPLPTRAKPAKQKQMLIVDVRPVTKGSIQLVLKSNVGSEAPKAQRSSEKNIAPVVAPVVDWVWESSSDLAVRYSELSSAFDQAAMAVIPRPLPTRAKPAKQKQMLIVDVRPVTKGSIQLVLKSNVGSEAPKAQRSSENNIAPVVAPVVDWVWESSSDLAVRYSELSSAFDQAAMAVIPRPLPNRAKPAKQKQMLIVDVRPVTKVSIQLVPKSNVGPSTQKPAEEKRKLIAGRNDYWNYYAHCDRWNVVFTKPDDTSKGRSNSANEEEIFNADVLANQKPYLDLGLQELAALVADRWGDAMAFYRAFSTQFQTSQN